MFINVPLSIIGLKAVVDCEIITVSEMGKQPERCFTPRLHLSPHISCPTHHFTRSYRYNV